MIPKESWRLRRSLAGILRAVRAAVEPPVAATSEATLDHGLRPEDVQLPAFQVLARQGVGWEFAYVDVREPGELAANGAIPDALHIPLGQLEARWREIPTDVSTVVVCASGMRSTTAALRLRALGHPDAWSLEGGMSAWAREGGPVERV